MTIEITDAMVEAFIRPFRAAGSAHQGRIDGLAAVLALPEVRRAIVMDMPTDDIMEALHASSYATPEEASRA